MSFALNPTTSTLLVIDVQERFLPAIPAIAADQPVGRQIGILAQAARLLDVRTLISEQYVKGLGPTLPAVLEAAGDEAERWEKTHFSCLDDPALGERLTNPLPSHVILAGIETHVCVLGTAADLRDRGIPVIIAADAVASRVDANRDHALRAAIQLGCLVLPVESILFRWQRQAGVGCFKQIAALVR